MTFSSSHIPKDCLTEPPSKGVCIPHWDKRQVSKKRRGAAIKITGKTLGGRRKV